MEEKGDKIWVAFFRNKSGYESYDKIKLHSFMKIKNKIKIDQINDSRKWVPKKIVFF